MRLELLTYLKSLKLKNFGISDELPFTSGVAMYLKNPKKIYVGTEQITSQPFIAAMGNYSVYSEVHTVGVFFSTDAKNLPSDYDAVVALVQAGKGITVDSSYFRRELDTATSYEGDLMVTQLDFRFTKLTS